jgi:hypothetical protein
MEKDERDNWERIKEHMESTGNTDNQFYIRAVAICAGLDDPLKPLE